MDNDLRLLLHILARSDCDVRGHGSAERLTPDDSALLERFVEGNTSAEERSELLLSLKRKPEWIDWIAMRVKSGRQASTGSN